MATETKIGKTLLRLVTGDIADQDTDAVVTAAHWRLNKGAATARFTRKAVQEFTKNAERSVAVLLERR